MPSAQIVGVPRPELTEFLAGCLRRLGVARAWVVHGSGIDEMSLCGPTRVTAFDDGEMRTFTVRPEDAGLPPCAAPPCRAATPARTRTSRAACSKAAAARRETWCC